MYIYVYMYSYTYLYTFQFLDDKVPSGNSRFYILWLLQVAVFQKGSFELCTKIFCSSRILFAEMKELWANGSDCNRETIESINQSFVPFCIDGLLDCVETCLRRKHNLFVCVCLVTVKSDKEINKIKIDSNFIELYRKGLTYCISRK